MNRLVVVAPLKPGAEARARQLLDEGPPFDLEGSAFDAHEVFVTPEEVVFVFEGHEVEWIVDQLIDEPFHYELHRALEQWREIVDGRPRVARERFGWQLDAGESIAITASERSKSWA